MRRSGVAAMSDPAIEAARRAWESERWGGLGRPLEEGMSEASLAKESAREALVPIRKLHKPSNGANCGCCNVCIECDLPWPCDTAKLCYPSEEL